MSVARVRMVYVPLPPGVQANDQDSAPSASCHGPLSMLTSTKSTFEVGSFALPPMISVPERLIVWLSTSETSVEVGESASTMSDAPLVPLISPSHGGMLRRNTRSSLNLCWLALGLLCVTKALLGATAFGSLQARLRCSRFISLDMATASSGNKGAIGAAPDSEFRPEGKKLKKFQATSQVLLTRSKATALPG
jgi:hypothetical protein